MKRIVFFALNSSFSHTNLAVRSIRQSLLQSMPDNDIVLVEQTVNDRWMTLFRELYEAGGDIYLFSCYIWNRELMIDLARSLKTARPEAVIVFGGPDAYVNAGNILARYPEIDHIISGEGEDALVDWLAAGAPSDPKLLNGGEVDHWPYPYAEGEIAALSDRILYYESSRGCPMNCTYCLSSVSNGIRFKSVAETSAEIDAMLADNPRQIKFVDRTFNADRSRATAIWRHLLDASERLGTRTNFHFEIAAELLTDSMCDLLSDIPTGIFQFEIGAQTTNPEVSKLIRRPYHAERFRKNVKALRRAGKMHLHLDLIAGLPGETLASQIDSANDLLTLRPHMLQMGLLKVLPGTPMMRDARERDFVYQQNPPYEILASDKMSVDDLMTYRRYEDMCNAIYNSGHMYFAMSFLLAMFYRPFDVIIAFADRFADRDKRGAVSMKERFAQVAEFGKSLFDRPDSASSLRRQSLEDKEHTDFVREMRARWLSNGTERAKRVFSDLLKLDYLLMNQRDYPAWANSLQTTDNPERLRAQRRVMREYKDRGERGRGRFEDFSFSVDELWRLLDFEDYYSVGAVMPDPAVWLENLVYKPRLAAFVQGNRISFRFEVPDDEYDILEGSKKMSNLEDSI